MGAVVQMEFFPGVTAADKVATKKLLKDYPKMIRKIRVYEKKESLTNLESKEFKDFSHKVREIDRAFELIEDDEVMDIIKHRYVNARKHKLTLLKYTASTSAATINRRIRVGVATIADHLKLAEII